MTAVELEHPTGSVLTAYSLGELGEAELAGIDAHLAECEVCRQVVEGVAPDTLVALLRSAATDVIKCDAPTAATPQAALKDHPRYRVGELLGVGGMGAVYKAEHLLMERPVALKVLNRDLIDRPATLERFRREVRAAARLTHPNIVAAFDAEQVGDVHFLVMEYVEGVSLSRRSTEHGPLPVAEACGYIRQAAVGLQHAHECGMVHRDIKPQNLMLTPSGQVKILDFGLARFVSEGRGARGEGREKSGEGRVASGERIQEGIEVGSEEEHSSGILHSSSLVSRPSPLLTDTGLTMGTPDYIAPEQARDSRVADIRADIYSLGCTLYDLLAGHAPFPDGNATQKVKAHLERTPAPLRSLRRDVPVELARVVERMIAKDLAERFQTPAEVVNALAPFVAPSGRYAASGWFAATFAVVAALVAGVIIYVQTDHGTITVETNDDKIAVMIEKAGGVKIIDKANNREYLLRPGAQEVPGGDYQIDVSEALAGLDFQTKEFKLRRGKEVRLTAKFVANGKGQAVLGAVGVDRKRGEERLKILRTIVSQLEEQHKRGATDFEKVMQAKRDVAKAEVEWAQSGQEKVKALESLAAHAQKLVDVRKVQFEAGVATQVDLLQANAELLEAQGALEREKHKAPAQASAVKTGRCTAVRPCAIGWTSFRMLIGSFASRPWKRWAASRRRTRS